MAIARQLLHMQCTQTLTPKFSPNTPHSIPISWVAPSSITKLQKLSNLKGTSPFITITIPKASPSGDRIVPADDEDGVSLGTMKLPPNTDVPRFETLLFQWANSLCQGANLPLPVPLKVDKVQGGARLGFISVDDGKTQVVVYIDCLVFPATSESAGLPLFRAIRNGLMKDKVAPGEERIMRSLLQALQTSAEIARI